MKVYLDDKNWLWKVIRERMKQVWSLMGFGEKKTRGRMKDMM